MSVTYLMYIDLVAAVATAGVLYMLYHSVRATINLAKGGGAAAQGARLPAAARRARRTNGKRNKR